MKGILRRVREGVYERDEGEGDEEGNDAADAGEVHDCGYVTYLDLETCRDADEMKREMFGKRQSCPQVRSCEVWLV